MRPAAALRPISLIVLLAAAGAAAAQKQDAAPAKPPADRSPLNLKLEERPQPRITFAPVEGKDEKRPADTLPTLGGTPSRAYERPLSPDAPDSPFPKDTNPAAR